MGASKQSALALTRTAASLRHIVTCDKEYLHAFSMLTGDALHSNFGALQFDVRLGEEPITERSLKIVALLVRCSPLVRQLSHIEYAAISVAVIKSRAAFSYWRPLRLLTGTDRRSRRESMRINLDAVSCILFRSFPSRIHHKAFDSRTSSSLAQVADQDMSPR
jgi:hypothetical protein